jgi:tetrapyrrole methylase family protein/MazG family protein
LSRHTLTIVGLGPGDFGLLTNEAVGLLSQSARVYIRTARHPTVDSLRSEFPHLAMEFFDDCYERHDTFDEVYAAIVARITDRLRAEDVVFCVPGSPFVDEATVRLLLRAHPDARIVQGLSFIEVVLGATPDIDPTWLSVVDAGEIHVLASANAVGEVAGLPGLMPVTIPRPTAPLIVSQIYAPDVGASVKLWLARFWPDDHRVRLVRAAGTPVQRVDELPIFELDRVELDHLCTLVVPALPPIEDVRTFEGLLNITRRLRAPGGCPWDREQTHQSLKRHLLEETYEAIEALDDEDSSKLAEELGDVLFQVAIHSQLADEFAEFDIQEVVGGISSKLVRRHPHVFGDLDLSSSGAVLQQWEVWKDQERPNRDSVLDGIPRNMPALSESDSIQRRASTLGFDWPDISGVWAKLEEELDELKHELDGEGSGNDLDEMGDLLFTMVSLARWIKIDPEEAMRKANLKFRTRLALMEDMAKATDKALRELTPAELDTLWHRAKRTLSGEG